jgi:hypothetical protein
MKFVIVEPSNLASIHNDLKSLTNKLRPVVDTHMLPVVRNWLEDPENLYNYLSDKNNGHKFGDALSRTTRIKLLLIKE